MFPNQRGRVGACMRSKVCLNYFSEQREATRYNLSTANVYPSPSLLIPHYVFNKLTRAWYYLWGRVLPARIAKQLLQEVSASPLTLRISIRCQAHNLTWWKWQQAMLTHTPHHIVCTWMFNCQLLFSLALSCREQDTATECEWKNTLSLSYCT